MGHFIQSFVWTPVVENFNQFVEAGRQAALRENRSNTRKAWFSRVEESASQVSRKRLA